MTAFPLMSGYINNPSSVDYVKNSLTGGKSSRTVRMYRQVLESLQSPINTWTGFRLILNGTLHSVIVSMGTFGSVV